MRKIACFFPVFVCMLYIQALNYAGFHLLGDEEKVCSAWLSGQTRIWLWVRDASKKGTGDLMAQEMVRRVCEHCGTAYTALEGNTVAHCVHCFSCEQHKPLNTMYGRVGEMGYCCQACEAAEHWSSRLVFSVVLNLPHRLSVNAN